MYSALLKPDDRPRGQNSESLDDSHKAASSRRQCLETVQDTLESTIKRPSSDIEVRSKGPSRVIVERIDARRASETERGLDHLMEGFKDLFIPRYSVLAS